MSKLNSGDSPEMIGGFKGLSNYKNPLAKALLANYDIAYRFAVVASYERHLRLQRENSLSYADGKNLERIANMNARWVDETCQLLEVLEHGVKLHYTVSVDSHSIHGGAFSETDQFPLMAFEKISEAVACAVHYASLFSERNVNVTHIRTGYTMALGGVCLCDLVGHDNENNEEICAAKGHGTLNARSSVILQLDNNENEFDDSDACVDPVMFNNLGLSSFAVGREMEFTNPYTCGYCGVRTCHRERFSLAWGTPFGWYARREQPIRILREVESK